MNTVKYSPAQKAAATRAANREQRNRDLSLAIANAWHRNVNPLYSSEAGSVQYGSGTHDAEAWDRYSKGWHRSHGPSRWKNAGVTRDIKTGLVRIYPVRGAAIELDTPLSLLSAHLAPLPALLDGDIYAVRQQDGSYVRHGLRGPTGYALHHPRLRYNSGWEHGVTLEECRAELAEKLRYQRGQEIEAKRTNAERRRLERRISLVLILCKNAVATLDDARGAGYCRAGIAAFQERHGFGDSVPLRDLVATGNPQAVSLARRVAALPNPRRTA